MGAEPYWYFTRYEPDVGAALQKLRRQEFEAGRYNPVLPFIEFPIEANAPAPGAQHASIDQAREEAAEDGTRSILDIDGVADSPDFGIAAPLDSSALEDVYGTTEPTHKMVEEKLEIFDQIERGQAVYVIVYRKGKPDELFFAGYSYD